MRSVQQIGTLYSQRAKAQAGDLERMRLFERYIAGDMPIAVAELDMNDQAAIANLASQGLEQMALRVASTLPAPQCPPTRPGIKESENRARKRRQAVLGWWEANDISEVLFLRAEHLLAHGLAPVTVLPDPSTGIPRWEVRSPTCTFPASCKSPLDIVPENCIFTSVQTYGWMCSRYGRQAGEMKRPKDCKEDDPITVIEYVDATEIVTCAKWGGTIGYETEGFAPEVELERIPNKAKIPLAFVPGWATLIGRRGKFNGTIGAHQMRAKLLAIAYLTARKGAMPPEWIEANQVGVQPEIISYPDPKTGEPGVVKDGKIVQQQVNPGFMTSPMLSILEREIRLEGGIPAEFGGEAAVGVRTGRRGDAILASTVDFPIQRAQRVLARALSEESKAAVHIVKEWTPAKKSFYVNWKGGNGWVDYDPISDFDSDEVSVSYALAGSDLNNDILRAQSKVGTGMWSKKTARQMDPETPDDEKEHDQIIIEQLEEISMGLFSQQVADGTLNVDDLFAFYEKIRKDKAEVVEALKEAHDQAKERQAAAAPQTPGMPEGMPPEGMPGLAAAPPQGGVPEELSDAGRLNFLLGQLNPQAA